MLWCNDICKVGNRALAEFRLGQCEWKPACVWGGGIFLLWHGRSRKTGQMCVSPYITLSYQWKTGPLNWSEIRDQVSFVLSHIKKVLNEIATLSHAYSHSYTHTPRARVWEWVCRVWQVGHDWLGKQEISSWQHFSLKGSLSSGTTCVSLFLCAYTARISVCVSVCLRRWRGKLSVGFRGLASFTSNHILQVSSRAGTVTYQQTVRHARTHTHTGA